MWLGVGQALDNPTAEKDGDLQQQGLYITPYFKESGMNKLWRIVSHDQFVFPSPDNKQKSGKGTFFLRGIISCSRTVSEARFSMAMQGGLRMKVCRRSKTIAWTHSGRKLSYSALSNWHSTSHSGVFGDTTKRAPGQSTHTSDGLNIANIRNPRPTDVFRGDEKWSQSTGRAFWCMDFGRFKKWDASSKRDAEAGKMSSRDA